jgi:iduronate 2-sulfatase
MLRSNPDRKIAIIKASKGGTSLRVDWNPGEKDRPETQGQCFRDFCMTYRLATDELKKSEIDFRVCGLLWHQGEADSKASSKLYEQGFYRFVERVRDEIGVPDLPVVVGEVFDNGKRDRVRTALQAIGNSGDLFGLVSADGTSTWDEGTHFDAASQLLLGQRYATAILEIHSKTAASPTQDQGLETRSLPIKPTSQHP